MQYFIGFVSPGSAETNNRCSGKLESFDCQLCQKYWCQKLSKSDNPSASYNRKCLGCFFSGHGVNPFFQRAHFIRVTQSYSGLGQYTKVLLWIVWAWLYTSGALPVTLPTALDYYLQVHLSPVSIVSTSPNVCFCTTWENANSIHSTNKVQFHCQKSLFKFTLKHAIKYKQPQIDGHSFTNGSSK